MHPTVVIHCHRVSVADASCKQRKRADATETIVAPIAELGESVSLHAVATHTTVSGSADVVVD
jgi:hypothetical protein